MLLPYIKCPSLLFVNESLSMSNTMRYSLAMVGLMATMLLVGCGGGNAASAKHPVKGTVTLDGQPMAEGTIFFRTASTGSVDSGPIVNGQFSLDAEAGSRSVEIAAYKMVTTGEGEMATENSVNWIPARYNTSTTLSAEVTTSGANEFSFNVTSQ